MVRVPGIMPREVWVVADGGMRAGQCTVRIPNAKTSTTTFNLDKLVVLDLFLTSACISCLFKDC
jgi:hypothetical protein